MRRTAAIALCVGLGAWAVHGAVFLVRFAGQLAGARELVQRDFTAFYFLTGAIRHHLDPNLPLPQLGDQLGLPGLTLYLHPTPHPPTAGVLLLPLSFLSLSGAGICWLAVSFAALIAAIVLLARVVGVRAPLWLAVAVALALATWDPVNADLSWGNINVVSLLLLAGMILCLRSGRLPLAGGLLAMALLLKPVVWPVVLLLLLRRQWRAVFGCGIVGGAVGLLTLAVVGPQALFQYVTKSLPLATQYYDGDFLNYSLARLGNRLFEGVYFPAHLPNLHFAPLIYFPLGAAMLAPIIIAGGVLGGLYATRRQSLESAIGTMICVSVAICPTVWSHYFVLVLASIAILLANLRRQSWPAAATRRTVMVLALLSIPFDGWTYLFTRMGQVVVPPDNYYWPVGPAMLALMPTYLLIVLTVIGVVVARPACPRQIPLAALTSRFRTAA